MLSKPAWKLPNLVACGDFKANFGRQIPHCDRLIMVAPLVLGVRDRTQWVERRRERLPPSKVILGAQGSGAVRVARRGFNSREKQCEVCSTWNAKMSRWIEKESSGGLACISLAIGGSSARTGGQGTRNFTSE